MIENDIKILQLGVSNSGVSWLYNIIQEILKVKNVECKSFIRNHPIYEEVKEKDFIESKKVGMDVMDIEPERCYYRVCSEAKNPIFYLPDYIRRCSHICTLSSVCEGIENVLNKFDKMVYIYRDPRAIAVSAAKSAFTPYMKKYFPHDFNSVEEYLNENYEELLHQWKRHLLGYLKLKDDYNIHFVAYENLIESFQKAIENIAAYLGFSVNNNEVLNIYKAVNFDVAKSGDYHYQQKSNKTVQWRECLDASQKERSQEIGGSLLQVLNYSSLEEEISTTPSDINLLHQEEINAIEEELRYAVAEV